MNIMLKSLIAIACIAVTIAAGVFVFKTFLMDGKDVKPDDVITVVERKVICPNPECKACVTITSKKGEKAICPKCSNAIPDSEPVVEVVPCEPSEKSKIKISEPVVVSENDPIQPQYVPINQPAYLQNVRMEGKTYHSRVIGKVFGSASKKDWGIRGSAYFTYFYGVESIGKIIKNDGINIVEERTFGKVSENVFVSDYIVSFELPPEVKTGINILCSTIGGRFGGDAGVEGGWVFGEGFNEGLSSVKIPINDDMVGDLRESGMLPPELDPQKIKNKMMMFSKIGDGKILEGKKVKIIFADGQGITQIIPIGCELSQQEIDVIKRTNFVMDHYLFPDQQVAPDTTWEVDGNVFSGFLDPRIQGQVRGKVTVKRIPDFTTSNNEVNKRLRLMNGHISFTDNSGGNNIVTGQLNSLQGTCIIPNQYGVVTSANISGMMEYKNVSTDHLLFAAEMSVVPRIEIKYECEVK